MAILAIHVPNKVMRDLRRNARQHGVSVNRLVRRLIDGHAQLNDPHGLSGVYEILLDYVLGKISQGKACAQIGVDRWTLWDLTRAAYLPEPRLSKRRTEAMVRGLHEFLERHGIEFGKPNEDSRPE